MVSVLNVARTVQTVLQATSLLPGGGFRADWRSSLQPASWRGVPFGWDATETTAGRNTAVHVYPLREVAPVWVEDLGVAPMPTRITGFLVGDDVARQQDAMIAAMQVRGPGELVHPMRGALYGSVVGGCRFVARKDRGRCIEFTFEFVENNNFNPYPLAQVSTGGNVDAAATQAAQASRVQAQQEAGAVTGQTDAVGRISKSPAEASAISERAYFDTRAAGGSGAEATLAANSSSLQARSYMTLRQDRLNGYVQ